MRDQAQARCKIQTTRSILAHGPDVRTASTSRQKEFTNQRQPARDPTLRATLPACSNMAIRCRETMCE